MTVYTASPELQSAVDLSCVQPPTDQTACTQTRAQIQSREAALHAAEPHVHSRSLAML